MQFGFQFSHLYVIWFWCPHFICLVCTVYPNHNPQCTLCFILITDIFWFVEFNVFHVLYCISYLNFRLPIDLYCIILIVNEQSSWNVILCVSIWGVRYSIFKFGFKYWSFTSLELSKHFIKQVHSPHWIFDI